MIDSRQSQDEGYYGSYGRKNARNDARSSGQTTYTTDGGSRIYSTRTGELLSGGSSTGRFSRLGGGGGLIGGSGVGGSFGNYFDIGDEPTYESARQEASRGSQGLIDAIKAQFQPKFQREREAGVLRAKRGAALSSNAGLSGSTFATSKGNEIDTYNQEAINSIEAEMNQKIAEIMFGVEQRASDIYEKRRAEYSTKAEKALENRKEFAAEALKDVALLASTGTTADNLKENAPDQWQQLLEETGKSDAELTAYFISNKPEAEQLFKERVGNSIVFGFKDPVTGKTYTEKIDMPGEEWDYVANGGNPLFINKATGQYKEIGASGGGSSQNKYKFTTGDKSILLGSNYTVNDIAGIEADLNSGQYTIEQILSNATDFTQEQKNVLKTVLSGSQKPQTNLTRESVATFLNQNDTPDRQGIFGIKKSGKAKIDEVMAAIGRYRAIGKTDTEIAKILFDQ